MNLSIYLFFVIELIEFLGLPSVLCEFSWMVLVDSTCHGVVLIDSKLLWAAFLLSDKS